MWQDAFVTALLDQCGRILEWNRKSDPQTKRLSNFGFCKFDKPESARRAVKLLNEFKVDYQPISVKIGKKELEVLEKLQLPETPEKDEVRATYGGL